jgi:hypothetical protein
MDERKEFERWASDDWTSPNAVLKDADGIYKLMSVQQQWRAWQASAEQSRAECEALRKYKAAAMLMVEDAMRYQFLRTQPYEFWKRIGFMGCPQDQGEAIDAAMGKESGND